MAVLHWEHGDTIVLDHMPLVDTARNHQCSLTCIISGNREHLPRLAYCGLSHCLLLKDDRAVKSFLSVTSKVMEQKPIPCRQK